MLPAPPIAVGLVSNFLSVVSLPSGPLCSLHCYSFSVSREECLRIVLLYSEGAQSNLIVKPRLLASVCLAAVLKGGQVTWAWRRLLPSVTCCPCFLGSEGRLCNSQRYFPWFWGGLSVLVQGTPRELRASVSQYLEDCWMVFQVVKNNKGQSPSSKLLEDRKARDGPRAPELLCLRQEFPFGWNLG